MSQYDWVLFDADDTLFHFDAFAGLRLLFSQFDIQFSEENYSEYQALNKALWLEYQNGKINAKQLQVQRFSQWANRLKLSAQDLNSAFLAVMAEICKPLDGAEDLLNSLKGRAKLGIVTNGFTELQEARLARSGLRAHFELLVISEQIGIAKPDRAIFDHTLGLMGDPERERVLMVGDNPETDILGGINSGLHTCWLNAQNKAAPEHIKPQYQVGSLFELQELLGKL